VAVQREAPHRAVGRPTDHKEGEIREAIRKAAIQLIGDKGFDAVTTAEIAQRARTTKPMLYYYYGSKQELLSRILAEVHEKNMERMRLVVADDSQGVVARIEALLRWQNASVASSPTIHRFIHRLMSSPPRFLKSGPAPHILKRSYEQLLALANKGIERGELRGEPATIAASIQAIFHYTMMRCFMNHEGKDVLPALAPEDMFAALLQGIQAPHHTTSRRGPTATKQFSEAVVRRAR
jgi:AcrR family transcriptional regulator